MGPRPDEAVPTSGSELHADHPEAYIARDRRRALAAGTDLPDRVTGSALFADISGFTPLTEALAAELGPQRGAEELTANIGRIFHAVIDELDAFGGDVIYFSGDAITCWIDGDDGLAAASAAIAMLEAIDRTGLIVTPGGSQVRLAMKVAIAVGDARRFVVGDPDVQLIDVLAGHLVDDLAAAEHFAEKGEVILEPSAISGLGDRAQISDRRVDPETGREYAVLTGLTALASRQPVVEPPPLSEELIRPWLLPAVYERLRTGSGEFLTELRPAIPVFLRFSGIDYDEDDDAVRKLDEFVRAAQKIMSGYGGNVLQLTLGDKGAYLYGVFGSPVAHEDDEARAAAAALELRDLERTTSARDLQIGITQGRLRSGTYGHVMRRTFVCLGDEVNLSARLMSAAPPGRIYVSQRIQQGAGEAFIWERLPDMKVKGKAEPVPVYALKGSLERASRRKTRFELRLVGRRQELGTLHAGLADATAGHGRIVGIAAEAGMGKSRLIAEFVRSARRSGHLVAFGECQAFGTTSAYFAFREIWRRLFLLEDGNSEASQVADLQKHLWRIDPGLVARAPLLDAILGLTISDTDLTRSFDAKLRKASLEDLLLTCLGGRSRDEPLVVVLEDCHWMDELSLDLLRVLARGCADLRVLFVLAYRPTPSRGGGLGIEELPYFYEIPLDRLDDEDAAAVVRSKVQQVMGRAKATSDALAELVTRRADGNPLYIEELISYIAGQGIDMSDATAIEGLQLPDSLHTIVLSRIDTVAEEPRRTMKVGSVVGRVFRAPMLPGAYAELGSLEDVRGHLDVLRAVDLVGIEREEDMSYLFKHVVTQEVAYESMPFALRSVLHRRLAGYIEASNPEAVERNLDLLAHHYWRGDDEAKKREYLGRAARAAQAAYANTAAIDYFERLLPLVEGTDRVGVGLSLGRTLELAGAWQRAEEVDHAALELAVELDDEPSIAAAEVALAEVARKQGRYDEASTRLSAAADGFRTLGDDAGIGRVLHLAGTVAAQQGDYATARARYQESVTIRTRVKDLDQLARVVENLGIIAEYEGDNHEARRLMSESLAIRRGLGDRWAIAMGQSNLGVISLHLGEYQDALERFEESATNAREVGDPWLLALARENRGNAKRLLGDLIGASDDLSAAIRAHMTFGDRYYSAILLEDVAVLATASGEHATAIELAAAAERLREEIGAVRPAALAEELAGDLAPAHEAVGPEAAASAVERGRGLDLAGALAKGLLSCEVAGEEH